MAMKPEEIVLEEAGRANNVPPQSPRINVDSPKMEQGGDENAERIEEEEANAVEAQVEMEDAMEARPEIPDLNLPTEEREEEEEEEEIVNLITVGCKGCYRYMMVPENNKKCLSCGLGTSLFKIPKLKKRSE